MLSLTVAVACVGVLLLGPRVLHFQNASGIVSTDVYTCPRTCLVSKQSSRSTREASCSTCPHARMSPHHLAPRRLLGPFEGTCIDLRATKLIGVSHLVALATAAFFAGHHTSLMHAMRQQLLLSSADASLVHSKISAACVPWHVASPGPRCLMAAQACVS